MIAIGIRPDRLCRLLRSPRHKPSVPTACPLRGFCIEPRQFPLLFQDAGAIFLRSADRLRQMLKFRGFLDQNDGLCGLDDTVAPKRAAAVAFENCEGMRVDLEIFQDEVDLTGAAVDMYRYLSRKRVPLRGDI